MVTRSSYLNSSCERSDIEGFSFSLPVVGVLFSPVVSRWLGRQACGGEKFVRAISQITVRCRKLILSRDIG